MKRETLNWLNSWVEQKDSDFVGNAARDILAHIQAQDAIIELDREAADKYDELCKENEDLRQAIIEATTAYAEQAKQLRARIAELEEKIEDWRNESLEAAEMRDMD